MNAQKKKNMFLGNLNWQTSLITLFTLVLITSFLVQIYYVQPIIQEQQIETTKRQQEEVARNIVRELDVDLIRIENRLKRIAERPEFQEMDYLKQHTTMAQHVEISEVITSLTVMDAEGWFVSSNIDDISIFTTQSYSDQPYFTTAFTHGMVSYNPPRVYRNNVIGVTISVPIESETGEIVGVLIGGMQLNRLITHIMDYPLKEGTIAYVLDREGTVVAHSEIDLFTLEAGPLSLDYSDYAAFHPILIGEDGSSVHDHEGVPYFGSWVTLSTNGWGVVVEAPMSIVTAESGVLSNQLLLINSVIFGFALVASVVITRKIASEQDRLEGEMRENEALLLETHVRAENEQELGRLKTRFMSTATHEIRTPLSSIQGYTELIQMDEMNLTDTQRQYFEVIQRNVRRLTKLTDDLLDVQRLEEGITVLTLEQVNVQELLDDVENEFTPILVGKNQRLVVNSVDAVLNMDRLRVMQVLVNLLSNASKFSPEDGAINVDVVEVGDELRFSVSDIGFGLSEEDIEKLFMPFPIIDRLVVTEQSTGLGLSISRGIVELHGGRIWAESEGEGKGSRFSFTIPNQQQNNKDRVSGLEKMREGSA